jgi:hypothetical protein
VKSIKVNGQLDGIESLMIDNGQIEKIGNEGTI